MEYMTPNFTKDMVKTHKILIPNMAVTQFRLLQAALECEGLLPPKHDAGIATRHYRAFWQRRCRAAAVGAVLKPLGGNCAVLP